MSTTASAASSACRRSTAAARRTTAWSSTTPSGDKLFLPVENLELLSRYGSEDTEAQLDRLGGAGWQNRKARMKNRIREIAARADQDRGRARHCRPAPKLVPPDGLYDEFCARFPYDETEDQLAAIEAVLDDLASGHPMDRLVCGDVGFGKTEVALRAAFAAAINGKQVAVVVPTTLLARQHIKTFAERFAGLPVKVAQMSRMVTAGRTKQTKARASPTARSTSSSAPMRCSARPCRFKDLGLVIIDEEQHFGVAHKERLKELRAEVHVLTLSATPIPRTLQLAHDGRARPLDHRDAAGRPPGGAHLRLAVRRGAGARGAAARALSRRPELLRLPAHRGPRGGVRPSCAETCRRRSSSIGARPDGGRPSSRTRCRPSTRASTTCCSRPRSSNPASTSRRANTLIVHRADMFGLAQLYQLRGRVGRSKTRAYALFTLPAEQARSTPQAEKRLKVLQSLDTLGAGFQLASHDLDIRGAGNLLGDEQSGHIKEVGYELYQQMLQEAIDGAEGRRSRDRGRGDLVAVDHGRHAGDDPGGLRARPARCASASTAASSALETDERDRELRRRADRPLRASCPTRSSSC